MDSYRTLKVSAGRHTFGPGQTIDLPADEAASLLGAGAIEPLSRPSPRAELPATATPAADASASPRPRRSRKDD